MKTAEATLPWSGLALVVAGALTILINALLTPLLRPDAAYSMTAASSLFLWRQALSAAAALCLVAGSVSVHLRQADAAGRLGGTAFAVAFAGSALLFATEWSQVFFVRAVALAVPEALEVLDRAAGPSLFDIGAMIALLAFFLGWVAFSISMLWSGVFARRGPSLVIAGLFAVPILGAALPAMWGVVVGNAVLGCGWILLGRELVAGR